MQEKHCNRYRTLHGGCIATLIDLCTSIGASVVTKTFATMDVSIDLQVSYLSAAAPGDVLRIVTSCDKVSKSLIFNSAQVWNGDKLVAKGCHTKFIMKAKL